MNILNLVKKNISNSQPIAISWRLLSKWSDLRCIWLYKLFGAFWWLGVDGVPLGYISYKQVMMSINLVLDVEHDDLAFYLVNDSSVVERALMSSSRGDIGSFAFWLKQVCLFSTEVSSRPPRQITAFLVMLQLCTVVWDQSMKWSRSDSSYISRSKHSGISFLQYKYTIVSTVTTALHCIH